MRAVCTTTPPRRRTDPILVAFRPQVKRLARQSFWSPTRRPQARRDARASRWLVSREMATAPSAAPATSRATSRSGRAADLEDADIITLAVRAFAAELGVPEWMVEIYGDRGEKPCAGRLAMRWPGAVRSAPAAADGLPIAAILSRNRAGQTKTRPWVSSSARAQDSNPTTFWRNQLNGQLGVTQKLETVALTNLPMPNQ